MSCMVWYEGDYDDDDDCFVFNNSYKTYRKKKRGESVCKSVSQSIVRHMQKSRCAILTHCHCHHNYNK